MRFHAPTPSSGWKKVGMLCSWSRLRLGALRYQSSLNADTVATLSSPGGKTSGTETFTDCA